MFKKLLVVFKKSLLILSEEKTKYKALQIQLWTEGQKM